MPQSPRLILDVMGGDKGPSIALEGALQAFPELVGELVLVGDQAVIREELKKRRFRDIARAIDTRATTGRRVTLQHASETIGMEDSIKAVRVKKDASINVGCRMAAADYEASLKNSSAHQPSAFISAGHSGAMMTSALLNMGRIRGIERPAIAIKLPNLGADGCVILDVGANVDCKPEHLRDFAIMGALFAQVEKISPGLPRVGVMANGEEKSKGNTLSQSAYDLIETHTSFSPTNPQAVGQFMGNAEGRDIFRGNFEVIVMDGFVGNVVLKALEGVGSAVVNTMKQTAKASPFTLAGYAIATGGLKQLKRKLDYAEYGAAPLLGVAGYAYICHGRSNAKAYKNALLRAQSGLKSHFVERLAAAVQQASQGLSPNEKPKSSSTGSPSEKPA